jgi:hypothetical protein
MTRFRRLLIAVAGSGLLSLSAATAAGAGVPSAYSTGQPSVPVATSSGPGVSGIVTSAATEKPVKGACVNVVEASDNTTVGTSAPTNKKGAWSLHGIPASTDYTAIARGCNGEKYVGQWYDDQNYQSDATQFAVSAGATTKGIDFSLSVGGNITGKVTDSATKEPVQGILVIALWATDDSASTYSQCTSSTGVYKLEAVPTSGAKIEFVPDDCGVSSNYGVVFYKNAQDYGSAKVVPVTAGKTTKNINQKVTSTSST